MSSFNTGLVSLFFIAIFGVFGLGFCRLPGLIAALRKHNNRAAILALNFLTGWTFLGWVGAMVWAFSDTVPPKVYEPACGSFSTGSR